MEGREDLHLGEHALLLHIVERDAVLGAQQEAVDGGREQRVDAVRLRELLHHFAIRRQNVDQRVLD